MAYQPKSYRKFVATAATATLVATAVTPAFAASADDFTDVAPRYKEAVNYLVQNDIAQGINQKQFGVTLNIKRSDAAVMIAKALKLDTTKAPDAGFTDVPPRAVASVNALVEAKILSGKTSTKFGADDNLTRGEMALILTKAYKLDGAGAEHKFTDVAPRYEDAVKALVKNDITQGKSDTKFGTADSISRGEFAIFVYKAETKDELKVDTVSVATKDEVTTVSATVKNAAKDAEATVEIFANGDTTKPAAATQKAKVVDGKVSAEFKNLPEGNHVAKVTVDKASKEAKFTVEAAPAAKVASVTAINGKQVEIQFNKAVKKSTVIDGSDNLINVTFNSLDSKQVTGLKAVLSEDGKTVTVTTADLFEGRYDVNIKDVSTTKDEKVAEFKEVVTFGKDVTAPAIASVEKKNAMETVVTFSEPLASAGAWTFKLANGNDANDKVSVSALSADKKSVTLTVTDAELAAGTEIVATVVGAKDAADNLINPNPTTVKFTKGAKDGVAPTVSSVTALGLDKFEIKFSEEIQTLSKDAIKVDGTPATNVEQDKTDKTKYTVTIGAVTAGLHTVTIDENAVTDLSGEKLAAYSKVVNFAKDTVAPKLVKSEIQKNSAGKEMLVLTFDEEVKEPTQVAALNAIQKDKDLVTTTGTIDLSGLKSVEGNSKQLFILLDAAKFNTAALKNGATYTVDLEKITDTTDNELAKTQIKFARGGDTPEQSKPVVESVLPVVGNNNAVEVTFDKEVDGATATDVKNYNISGAVIEEAILSPVDAGKQKVTLKLKEDSNLLSGDRAVIISGVKAKVGLAMDQYKGIVKLNENVAPTITSAQLTGKDEITLTFSEKVYDTTTTADEDFNLFVGNATSKSDKTLAVQAVAMDSAKNTLKLTVSEAITPDELSQGLTVKSASTVDVKDTAGNKVKTPVSVKVAQ